MMKKVLGFIMFSVVAILTIGINLAGIQFFYEAINYHLSADTILGMFFVGTTIIGLDSLMIWFVLDVMEDK